MTSSNPKSLPSIPIESTTPVHGLCVESDSLITALLCQAIAEEGLETQWLEPFKVALCDFGRYIETKETLYSGIRSSRQRLLTKFGRSLTPDSKPVRHQDGVTKEKTVHGDVELESIEPRKSVLPVESKLKQIRHRILTQTSTESSSPIHLLVAVSTTDNYDDTSIDSPYELPVILFEKDVFHFAHEGSGEADSDTIIYGLENWQGKIYSPHI